MNSSPVARISSASQLAEASRALEDQKRPVPLRVLRLGCCGVIAFSIASTSLRVVEDDAEHVSVARPDAADAVAQVHPIGAARAIDRTVMYSEPRQHHLGEAAPPLRATACVAAAR